MDMTKEDIASVFIGFLDVCNTALLANQGSFPYRQMLALTDKMFGGRNIGFSVYDVDPDNSLEHFTVRFAGNQIEPVAEDERPPDFKVKVKLDYMRKVVENRQEYIDHPWRLDWDWLKSRTGLAKDRATLANGAMTQNVHTLPPNASVREAAEMMKRLDVGLLVVRTGPTLVGVVTDRDILLRAVAAGLDPVTTALEKVMTSGVICCPENTEVARTAQIMVERKIRRLVVLDANNEPAGILSIGDIGVRGQDEKLAGEILTEICRPSAAPQIENR